MFTDILFFLAGAGLAYGAIVFLIAPQADLDQEDPQLKLKHAKEEADRVKKENEERITAMRHALELEEKSAGESLEKMEVLIGQKEEIVKRREERNKNTEEQMVALKKELEELSTQKGQLVNQTMAELAKRSKLTPEQALETARHNLETLITYNAEAHKKQALEDLEEDAQRHAKSILQIVIQRLGVPSSVDKNNTSVTVKDDKFKGLLVGKNGVNVQYLESLLPVSIIFNLGDSETIHVGGVNLIRRNIAKRAIEKLQTWVKKKGSLDHAMIKQAVDEADKEIMELCDRKGAESLKLVGLDPKQTPPELINYVGRLYLRTSYGQNVTGHSNEMAFAARMLAEAIGTDPMLALQGAFYHDIGKAIDHDVGGAHDDLSKEILEKFNYDPRIVHAAFAHHDKVPCEAPEDFLVKAVDAMSGGRPGARQESVTNYFERIQKLEEAALSFPGMQKVFAMSAGRELRVMVDRDRISDEEMSSIAEAMADKIEAEVAFPGVIKVNLIRVTKSVDYARELHKTSHK